MADEEVNKLRGRKPILVAMTAVVVFSFGVHTVLELIRVMKAETASREIGPQ